MLSLCRGSYANAQNKINHLWLKTCRYLWAQTCCLCQVKSYLYVRIYVYKLNNASSLCWNARLGSKNILFVPRVGKNAIIKEGEQFRV
jgi:hypothetical protein